MLKVRPADGDDASPYSTTDAIAWQHKRPDGSTDTLIEPLLSSATVAAFYGWSKKELAKRRCGGLGPQPTTRLPNGQYCYAYSDLLLWEQSLGKAEHDRLRAQSVAAAGGTT
jgi:hypothetical protein